MLGAGTFDPSNQPGNGLYVNGGLGSVLAEQLDLGVQISWYRRSTGGDQFVREGNLPDGTHYRRVMTTQSIKTDLVPVMGTLRVRIPVTSQVQPYVGGAAGCNNDTATMETYDPVADRWTYVAPMHTARSTFGTDNTGLDFQNDYDGFGAQVFGGVNLNVGPTTGLYGEAVWNASTTKAQFYDATIGQNVREEVDFDGLGFHGGLRLMF